MTMTQSSIVLGGQGPGFRRFRSQDSGRVAGLHGLSLAEPISECGYSTTSPRGVGRSEFRFSYSRTRPGTEVQPSG